MKLRIMMLVLMASFLGCSFGYAETDYVPLEKIRGTGRLSTYKNNFLGMEITIPSSMMIKIPVSSFERAPGDRMFFDTTGNTRTINITLHYKKFDADNYVHISSQPCGYGMPCPEHSYEQIKNPFNISNLIEKFFVKDAYAAWLRRTALKVDLEKRKFGKNEFFFYAVLEKNSGEEDYYFIYPLGKDYIEFAFFNQPEDVILNVMESISFFKGAHEDPDYPYWS